MTQLAGLLHSFAAIDWRFQGPYKLRFVLGLVLQSMHAQSPRDILGVAVLHSSSSIYGRDIVSSPQPGLRSANREHL